MIRDSLTPNGAHASMFMTAGNGPAFVQRAAAGGLATSTPTGTMAAPLWLKLELRADMVTAFQSADGLAWTTVGAVRLSLPSPYYIGWAVSSQDPLATATATFDNMMLSVPSAQNQPPTISLTAPDTSLTYDEPATITISAAAADSDGTISSVDFFEGSTLLGSTSTAPYSFTWSDVPEGSYTFSAVAHDNDGAATTSDLRSVSVRPPFNPRPTVALTSPTNGATFNAPATVTVSADASDINGSITRVDFYAGSTLIGSSSAAPYSVTWSSVAAGTYTLTAVATDNGGATRTSAARTITVNQRPTAALTAPANGATFTAPANIVISATASDADGTVTDVTFSAGSTVIGIDTTSPYSVTWSNVPAGTYVLKAVAEDNGGATTTSAARTITVNAAANQPPTVALTAPANGASFSAPATITMSATASDADGSVAKVDFFAGPTLVGTDATSPYSITWNNVAAGSYTLTAVATDDDGTTTTSAARSITVSGGTGTGLPAPWQQTDIGSPSAPGGAQYSSETFTIDGRGNLWMTPDQFHYVYQPFSGDITITAHVVSMENTSAWAKAGVMIRETLTGDSADAVMALTPGNGANFFYRSTRGAASQEPVSVGAGAWVRLQRRGTAITGYQSTDGVAWTAVGTMTLATSSMFVGLAASSDAPNLTATHVLDNVVVEVSTANQAPTAALTAPANGATFTAPATITVSANSSDSDGTVAKVDFFAGATLIGSDTTSPYSITWNNVAAGSYSLTAVATDDAGATTTSAARTITVNGPANQAPTVALTAPANGATFTAPATVTVSATASDTDGTLAKVDFFAGATLIGSDTTSPYSITWNNVAAGSYSLTAVATDDAGATTTSAARTITVNGPANQAPTVALTAPANGATFTAPATVTVSATASDTDGTLAKVDFFAGATLIGSDTTSPYSVTWSNVGAGTYSLTAVATDNGGATTTSAARTVTVSAAPPPTSAHAVFTASVDDSMVTRYVLDIFASGADPTTATPIRTQDMGKPPIVNGDCNVDITQTYNALPAGSYISTVSAVGSGGSSRSAAASFTK
jgi:regulation of enolase protein 1 (concanavalin A-like superfamily)